MDDVNSNILFGHEEQLLKALSTASGSGSNLIPEIVEPELRRFMETRTPLYNVLRKKPWPTNSYITRTVTNLPSATFTSDGGTLPARANQTYNKPAVAMKYIYNTVEITGPMQSSAPVVGVVEEELRGHTDGMLRVINQKLISGDAVGTPLEFDGFLKQITTNVKSNGSVARAVSLSLIDEALDSPWFYPTHMTTNRKQVRNINALLQAQQRFTSEIEVGAGFKVLSYNGVPIISVDNGITGLNDKIIMFNNEWATIAINRDLFVRQLAVTKDSDDFMLGMYLTFAVEGEEQYHAILSDLS